MSDHDNAPQLVPDNAADFKIGVVWFVVTWISCLAAAALAEWMALYRDGFLSQDVDRGVRDFLTFGMLTSAMAALVAGTARSATGVCWSTSRFAKAIACVGCGPVVIQILVNSFLRTEFPSRSTIVVTQLLSIALGFATARIVLHQQRENSPDDHPPPKPAP